MLERIAELLKELDERHDALYMPDRKSLDGNHLSMGPDEIEDLRDDVLKDLVELEKGNLEDIQSRADRIFRLYRELHGVEHPDKERLWQELSMIS